MGNIEKVSELLGIVVAKQGGEGKHQKEGWSSDTTSKAIGLLFRNSC